MMRQMRENTKWIMLVTAFAFVALMVFEWGMDITGQSGSGYGELGRVNGTPVTYDQYQAIYRNLYDQVSRGQDDPITSAQNREIEEAAWTELVNQILIQQELGRRGVRVTDQEVMDAARFSPPQELVGDPLFETDGQFDIQKYQDFLSNSADELFLLQLDAYYRDDHPQEQAPEADHFGDLLHRGGALGAISIREREGPGPIRRLQSRRSDHRRLGGGLGVGNRVLLPVQSGGLRGPCPGRGPKYVALTKAPLREDTAAAGRRAAEVRQELLDGADFAEVALRESSDEASAANGGDLGTFVRDQMTPAFDSVVFNSPLNRILEPVRTNYGFHIIEVLSRTGDSAQARHILIPVERTNESEIRLLTLADSLEALGESMTLDEAAGILGVPVSQQVMTELFPFLSGAGQISDGLDWAFREAAPGDVSPVFEDRQAFYMMQLVSVTPAGFQELENARPTIDRFLTLEKKVDLARAEAVRLLEEARAAGSLEVLSGRDGLQVQEAGPLARTEFFPGLGYQSLAVGAAFGLGPEEVSEPVVTELQRLPDPAAGEDPRRHHRLGGAKGYATGPKCVFGSAATARAVDQCHARGGDHRGPAGPGLEDSSPDRSGRAPLLAPLPIP